MVYNLPMHSLETLVAIGLKRRLTYGDIQQQQQQQQHQDDDDEEEEEVDINTTSWKALPIEIIATILSWLSFKDRLNCMTAIHKPWRSLRGVPMLWHCVSGSASRLLHGLSSGVCPDLSWVHDLDLIVDNAANAITLASKLHSLKKLTLSGKQADESVLESFNVAAHGKLEYLSLSHEVAHTFECAVPIIRTNNGLRVLNCAFYFTLKEAVNVFIELTCGNRDHAVLTHLTMNSSHGTRSDPAVLSILGDKLPYLSYLNLGGLGSELFVHAPLCPNFAFPSLRSVHISLNKSFIASNRVDKIIIGLLGGSPYLQHLSLVGPLQKLRHIRDSFGTNLPKKLAYVSEAFEGKNHSNLLSITLNAIRLAQPELLVSFNAPKMTCFTLYNIAVSACGVGAYCRAYRELNLDISIEEILNITAAIQASLGYCVKVTVPTDFIHASPHCYIYY